MGPLRHNMTSELEPVVSAELARLGYGLVRLRRGGTRSRQVIEVRIDREDGEPVNIGDCVRASRAIEARLDALADGPGLGRYELQVSSPGDAKRAPVAGPAGEESM
jgi:ribosome maturation factor RimP